MARKSTLKKTKSAESGKQPPQIHIWGIKLSQPCRDRLAKRIYMGDDWTVADQIESGNWYMPCGTHLFKEVKAMLNKQLHDFFSLPKSVKVTVVDYMSDIIAYR